MAREKRRVERVDFGAGGIDPIVARMKVLSKAGDGWINLVPKIDDDDERPTSLRFFTLFGGGGTGMTMSTWIPAKTAGDGHDPARLGITHVLGRRAKVELAVSSVPIPEGWFVEQDHPRRGLVLRIPPSEPHERVLAWALHAVGVLGPPRATAQWRADVYLPVDL